MIMKSFYACLIILFFATAPVFAQEQQAPSAADIVEKMQSKLNLTQDQLTAITPIIEKYSSKREELRQGMEDETADKDTTHAQMKQLREDEKKELSQFLSVDQLNQWEQMQKKGKHRHGNGGNAEGTSSSGTEN